MPNKEVKVVGGLGNATDTDVKAGVVYTSDNGIKRVGTAVYLTGSQTIKGDPNLKSENIAADVSIFGVNGSYIPKSEIIVAAPTGSTVTATLGTTVKTAVEQAGEWIFRNCDLGTWKIEARLSGQYATKNVEIKEDGQLVRYHVTLSYWQATITVTYPAGAVCTCSKGTTELTAPDTSGSHVFTVDEPGDWTVEATQWDDSSSEIVTVTDQNGAEYTIEVDFVTYLYNNGDDNFTLTGGWVIWSGNVTKDAESIRLLDGTTRAIIGTKNKIDLTPYSILSVKITDRSGSGGNEDKLGADSVTDHYKNPIVGTEIFGTGVTSVDISNCNRSLYVFVGSSRNGNDGRITFTEVWLK